MNITYKPYVRVKLGNLGAIQFLGEAFLPGLNAFRILDANGKATGYVGSFKPGNLATTHCFAVWREALATAMNQGEVHLGISEGICANTRIAGTLIAIAYPTGKLPVDFEAVYNASAKKLTIPLLPLEKAEPRIHMHRGVEFDNYEAVNRLLAEPERTLEVDSMPPADMIP